MRLSGRVKEQFITALEVPRDLAFSETIITITGPNRVMIENYKSIGKLTKEEISIFCIHGKIILKGKSMEVLHYSPEEMLIKGRIVDIEIM